MSIFHCIWCNKEIEATGPSEPGLSLSLFDKYYIFCNSCAKIIILEFLYSIDHPIIGSINHSPDTPQLTTLTIKEIKEGTNVICDLCKHEIKEKLYCELSIGSSKFNLCIKSCINTILITSILPEDSTFNMGQEDDFSKSYEQFLLEAPAEDKPKAETTVEKDITLATPREIKSIMDQHVIGQNRAKKILSVAVYEHYKKLKEYGNQPIPDDEILTTKKNILILGPTGCGKTHLTRVLASILKVPFYTAIAYNYTQEGYVGLSVNDMLKDLYLISGKNLEATQRGIIYIDEVDKIAKSSSSSGPDVNGASVQQALLSLVEGAKVSVELSRGNTVIIDTRNILFIAGGAFTDIIPIVEKRLGKNQKKSIGFGTGSTQNNAESIKPDANLYDLIKPQDLFNFGMLEEFIGRFPTFAPIANLTKDDLIKILTETKNSLISSYIATFKMDNIDLIFTQDCLDEIALQSIERKTGARGLDGIIDPIIKELEFDVAGDTDVISCTITREVIKGETGPIIKRHSDTP